MLDAAYVRTRLRYEPETGKLFWLPCPTRSVQWNGRYAGAEAFTAVSGCGYRHGTINGRTIRKHRIIWLLIHGSWPEDEVDHENQNKHDDRAANLRAADRVMNQRNVPRARNNTSGVTGVCWDKRKGKWMAAIKVHRRNRFLGYFDDLDDAAAARKVAEHKYGFHPNHGGTNAAA